MTVFFAWFRYQLERWVLRGSPALVLLLVALLTMVAVAGATIAYVLPGHHFTTFGAAVWWAILRISELLSDENRFVTKGMETVVTPLLAANLLCTLALHSKADQALAMALSHQATFFSRVVAVPGALARDLPLVSAAIRAAGYAFLTLLPETPTSTNRQIVICETARRLNEPAKVPLHESPQA